MASLAPNPVPADRFEPNDSLLRPANLGVVSVWLATWPFTALTIHNPSDQDFYLFSIETLIGQPFALDLTIENSLLDLDLYLYDANGEVVRNSVSGFEGEPEHLELQDLAPGAYTLEVSVYDGESLDPSMASAYQLRRNTNSQAVDQPPTVSGNLLAVALPGTPVTGQLVVSDADGLDPAGSFSLTTPAQNGTAAIDPQTGIWTYSPAADYSGDDRFVVTLHDRLGHTTEQTINTSVVPISLSLQPSASVVDGVATALTPLPENQPDRPTANSQTFSLQANLTSEQQAVLEQRAPALPIRFRLQLDPPVAQQQGSLSPNDLTFSVVAVDPTPAITANPAATTNPATNLLPDSNGFYQWPMFDHQTTGQGFVLADLTIHAIPVADNQAEGIETGIFSLVDLSGAAFPTTGGSVGQTAPNQGLLAFTDPLVPTTSSPFNLDVDGDGFVTALGDGLMIIRKLFGGAFQGTALTNKAIAADATRSADQIHAFIEAGINKGLLDVDQDGQTTALGDGLMIIRRLFGSAFEGSKLIQKAIGADSPYFATMEYQSVAANIDALKPPQAPSAVG